MFINRRFQKLDVDYYQKEPAQPGFVITYSNEPASVDNVKMVLTLQEATDLAIALDAAYGRALKHFSYLRGERPTLTLRPTGDQTEPQSLPSDL